MPTWVRASAETIPWVTVWPTPNGSPIASTTSPTCSSSELPNSSAGNFSRAPLSRITARSERALHLLAGQARVRSAEEPAEERIVEERRPVLDHLGRIDVDHGRGHPLDDRGIGQREFGGRAGHPALLSGGEAGESEQEERRKRGCAQA